MKKMLTTIMSVVMMLMVADVRLTANAAEVAEITVESVADDVNGDLEVNSKDVETIIDDLINNPNTQYCVADWVRVSKIVEEKIGPAICGYDISKMDVNPKNNEFILNELASASDLKVKMDENGVLSQEVKKMLQKFSSLTIVKLTQVVILTSLGDSQL